MGLFNRDPDADDGDQNPFEGRGFIVSAIVVGAVVVCGVAWFFLGRSDTPAATPSTQPTVAPSGSVTPVPTDPTGPPATPDETATATPTAGVDDPPAAAQPCKLPPNEVGLAKPPTSVVWEFEDGVLIPTKDDIGPGKPDRDGIRHCFRRSPAGAVFSAMSILAQAQNPKSTLKIVQQRVAPGAGQRVAMAAARAALASPTPDNRRNEVGQNQYVGYKVIAQTSTLAVLSLAIQVDPEHIGGIAVTMVWSGGDWKIQLRSDGELGPDPDLLASLDGYVRFRGA